MISNDKLYGLVLSGGKSTRMGEDKGLITYHDNPQREHLYHLLEAVCERTFLSVRSDQVQQLPSNFNTIVDTDEYGGPYNGILSAHKKFPGVSWLVLACDLPLIDMEAIQDLIAERDSLQMATAYAHLDNPLPEPLCAIWEPDALSNSIAYLEAGNGTCPRKFLLGQPVKLVFPKRKEVLLNANSQSEYEEAKMKLER